MPKIEELVDRSKGKIRADVAHRKITAMGYRGSERSTRPAVAEVKQAWRAGRRRRYRPWVPEPGMWLQWDWGEGPRIGGRRTQLFCAWLAWSRFRVVIPAWDQQLGTLTWCLDQALRAAGGAPTYLLTDNPKTVTMDHVAGIPVRHPEMVAVGRHYGCAVETCVPFDPESKGGVEATVKIAAADLCRRRRTCCRPTGSFAGLEEACREFCPGGPAADPRGTRVCVVPSPPVRAAMLGPWPGRSGPARRRRAGPEPAGPRPRCHWRPEHSSCHRRRIRSRQARDLARRLDIGHRRPQPAARQCGRHEHGHG